MTTREQKTYNQLIINVLDKLSNINQWRKDFIMETFILFYPSVGESTFYSLPATINIKNKGTEKKFEKPFDFLTFNKELTLQHGSGRYAIAFDPSYISKSSKKTLFEGHLQIHGS